MNINNALSTESNANPCALFLRPGELDPRLLADVFLKIGSPTIEMLAGQAQLSIEEVHKAMKRFQAKYRMLIMCRSQRYTVTSWGNLQFYAENGYVDNNENRYFIRRCDNEHDLIIIDLNDQTLRLYSSFLSIESDLDSVKIDENKNSGMFVIQSSSVTNLIQLTKLELAQAKYIFNEFVEPSLLI